ncbi:MAG: hypothetical protein FE048_04030 [Thermoplasmata archaeon]|nr:MAG: hypothetical protein FE048_04030 [Thermoplasmata archaeon]
MVEVNLEYVIEKITKKDNGEVEILAFGYTSEGAVRAVSSQMEMIMESVPPEMRQMLEQQSKMFEKQTKPMLKFCISAKEYAEGNWKVGDTLDTIIRERGERE